MVTTPALEVMTVENCVVSSAKFNTAVFVAFTVPLLLTPIAAAPLPPLLVNEISLVLPRLVAFTVTVGEERKFGMPLPMGTLLLIATTLVLFTVSGYTQLTCQRVSMVE